MVSCAGHARNRTNNGPAVSSSARCRGWSTARATRWGDESHAAAETRAVDQPVRPPRQGGSSCRACLLRLGTIKSRAADLGSGRGPNLTPALSGESGRRAAVTFPLLECDLLIGGNL